jgi:glycosyltransferase involved in cell wall biosynthesis
MSSDPERMPIWSVMIPVYNRTKYLCDTIDSVLSQGFSERELQIEVIDDCSSQNNPESLVGTKYGKRVSFYRQPQRVGMAANWNACIQRAHGTFIHILHQDDFVAQGYYREIQRLSVTYPEVSLYSTRSFFVDAESIITGVTNRVRELEKPTRSTEPFFYETPILFPGVTVRRSAYEALGGFRLDLGFVTDCEMWARVTGSHGAVVSTKVAAFHRLDNEHETARLARTAEGIRDICHLNELFSRRYPSFCIEQGRARVSMLAWQQYQNFKSLGDEASAAANREMWRQLTPINHRMGRQFANAVRPCVRKLLYGIGIS